MKIHWARLCPMPTKKKKGRAFFCPSVQVRIFFWPAPPSSTSFLFFFLLSKKEEFFSALPPSQKFLSEHHHHQQLFFLSTQANLFCLITFDGDKKILTLLFSFSSWWHLTAFFFSSLSLLFSFFLHYSLNLSF